jgi:hypothetical protein
VIKKILFLCTLFTVLSCSPESPKLEQRVYTQKVATDVNLDFNPKVDILFVVDDSGSMEAHQERLSKNVEVLTKSIEKNRVLDYHIGVITTTMGINDYRNVNYGGRLVSMPGKPRFVDRSTPGGMDLLRRYIQVGTSGASTEKVFEPAEAALSALATTYNVGFLRQDAYLVFIFITDSDDQSSKINGSDYSAQEFFNFTTKLKSGNAKKIIPYGIVIPSAINPGVGCARDSGPPKKLEDYISMLSGYVYDLCDRNYNSNLDFLGKDIVNRVSKFMVLNRRPIVSTIRVLYGAFEIPNDIDKGWSFDASKNAIVFGDVLMESLSGTSDKLEIIYTALPE